MKIVTISDTHEGHAGLESEIPEGDVLVHAGDFTYLGAPAAIKNFNAWLGTLPHKHKLVISGNHELTIAQFSGNAAFITNAIYLEDTGVEIEGVKFWGSPYTPRFGDWAFMKSQYALTEHWAQIPTDTDVLITHGPPWGVLDRPSERAGSCGDTALLARLQDLSPKLHVFGHIHGGAGITKHRETVFVNASVVDETYGWNGKPIQVVEI